jgi:lipopolysaccharide/colanic/teichoic acid biosynthesis glycosyltransferase
MVALISIAANVIDLQEISRIIVLGSLILAVLIEFAVLRFQTSSITRKENLIHFDFNITSFLRELILLVLSFTLCTFILYDAKFFSESNILILAGIFISWMIGAVFSLQFVSINRSISYIRLFWKYFKSYFILNVLSAFIVFSLRIELETQFFYMLAVLSYSISSWLVLTLIYLYRKPQSSDEIKYKILKATDATEIQKLENSFKEKSLYSLNDSQSNSSLFRNKLQSIYLKKFPEIFDFIARTINLNSIDELKSTVIRSSDPYNVEILPDKEMHLYINLHEVNDMRRLNQYFIEVNKRLVDGGLYISKIEPIRKRHQRFKESYPHYLAQIFYFFDFIWRRVFPKLPVLQKIYFSITKGRNRAISLAEGLGRLYYCGFEIINLWESGYYVYFIAKKIKEPSTDASPSYGPFFKMKRVGRHSQLIYVYKLRTMHPYAEYIQQFVFDTFGSSTGDKVNNDFRISYWGKIFRKFWIDEFPMLINLIKGDIKIVGVRPLSEHKFSIYPEDLQELRTKFKPGLIPPFYADLPESLEELLNSEKNYLESYFKNPLKTDIKYFFKAFNNIIFKNARSA